MSGWPQSTPTRFGVIHVGRAVCFGRPAMSVNDARVAIVTGAGRGIGQAIAERLAREGFYVAVADIDESHATSGCRVIGEAAFSVPVHVRSPVVVSAMVDFVQDRAGRIDVLVNNAGVAGQSAPSWELTDGQC